MNASLITRLPFIDRDSRREQDSDRIQSGWILPDPPFRLSEVKQFHSWDTLTSLFLKQNGGGKLFVLYGHSVVYSLALSLLSEPLFHGHGVVVLDAGNLFDPYLISRKAQALKRKPREFLSKILVSRSFTCHQTHALVRKIYTDYCENTFRVILVLGCLTNFCDEDVPFKEREALLKRTIELLKKIAQRGTKVLLTLSEPPFNVPSRWIDFLVCVADGAARIEFYRDGSFRLYPIKGMDADGFAGGLDHG